MKHNLVTLCSDLKIAQHYLGYCEKMNFTDETTASFQVHRDDTRKRLQNEMDRVSRLLWPETGRPYTGRWGVYLRDNSDMRMFGGTHAECVAYCNRGQVLGISPSKYLIAKWQ